MKKFFKFLLLAGLVICSLVLALLAYLHFGNLDPFRGKIESLVSEATGRKLSIDGHIDINLFPDPEVIVNNVSLANAKWGSEPVMMKVGHADASINFMSIFSDLFIVRQINVNDVSVLLEKNEQAVSNWVMGGKDVIKEGEALPDPPENDTQSGKTSDNIVQLPLMVDMAVLSGIVVKVRSPEQPEKTYTIEELSLKPDEAGNLLLATRGDLDGLPLALDGQISTGESVKLHEAVSLDLAGNLGDVQLKVQVATSRLSALADLNGQINVTVDDIQQALKKVKIESPVEGTLTADITAEQKSADSDLAVRVNGKLGTIAVDGDAIFIKKSLSKANVKLSVEDLEKIVALLDLDMAFSGPLTANLALTQEPDKSSELKMDVKAEGISATILATLLDSSLTEAKINLDVTDINKTLKSAKVEIPLNGPLTASTTISKDGETYKAKLDAKVDGLTAGVNATRTGNHTDLITSFGPLDRAGEIFEVEGVTANMLKLQVSLDQLEEKDIEVKDLQMEIGENRLKANGRLNLAGESAIKVSFSSTDLSTLLDTLPVTDLNGDISAEYSAEKVVLSPLAITFGKSDLNGDFTMLVGEKRDIKATLISKVLDLRPFSSGTSTSSEDAEVTETTEAGKPAVETDEEKSRYLFKEEPLKLDQLQAIEADIKLSVGHFYSGQIEFKDWILDGSLHDGNIKAKTKLTSASKGHAAIRLDLQTRENTATIDTLMSLNGFGLYMLSKGISKDEVPATSVTLELKTTGKSPRELASGANGRILLTQGPGKINSSVASMFTNDIIAQLLSALNPFDDDEEISQYDCTVLSINIVDGQADIDGLLTQSEKLMIVGGGHIDLKTEELKIEFNTKPRSGVGVSAGMFVTPFIKVTGTLAEPGIGLDKKGSLLTGGAAVATGGLSLLYKGLFDRVTAEGDHCEETLGEVDEHANYTF